MQQLNTVILGIDPDSDRHGVATYHDGALVELSMLSLIEFMDKYRDSKPDFVCIENVLANDFVYKRNQHAKRAAENKIAMLVGRNQQAQLEIQRALENMGIPYELHAPSKHNWAANDAMFKRVTGWSGRSNKDTRSAAFFGYLATQHYKKPKTNQETDMSQPEMKELTPFIKLVNSSTPIGIATKYHIKEQFELLQATCHGVARESGWWNNITTGEPIERNKGELLMLVVSEVAEAMEGERKNLMDDKLPHRKMAEVELADTIIRILDYAGAHKYDVAGAIIEKLQYNTRREDHKPENRAKENGKGF